MENVSICYLVQLYWQLISLVILLSWWEYVTWSPKVEQNYPVWQENKNIVEMFS